MPNNQRVVTAQDQLLICYQIEHEAKVLEGSLDEPPQRYQMGAGQWPEGIEQQMLGLEQGAQLQLEFKASDNIFGEIDPGRIVSMNQADFKHPPNLGELIEFTLPEGRQIEGQVLSLFDDNIEVDFNHPYAGRDLLIRIRIESIINT